MTLTISSIWLMPPPVLQGLGNDLRLATRWYLTASVRAVRRHPCTPLPLGVHEQKTCGRSSTTGARERMPASLLTGRESTVSTSRVATSTLIWTRWHPSLR